jgi:hypothetical protein
VPTTQRQGTRQLNVRVPTDVYDALRTYAYATDTTINDAVGRALVDFLSTKGRHDEISSFLQRARNQYRTTLDKLADL